MSSNTTLRTAAGRLRLAIEGPDGPPIAWTMRRYRPDQVRGDVIAGLTVAALIVPLSIGYAGVAGLPPENGLYASMLPLIAYAMFGSGRRVIVGPDASSAALIAATIAPLAAVSDDRVRLAGVLGLMVASLFVVMRLGRMGFLADFLSRPILIGYLAGVGITVVAGQVEKILGGPAITEGIGVLAHIDWSTADAAAVRDALSIAVTDSGAELISAALGGAVIVAMLFGRRYLPRVPMALVAMIVSLIASAVFDLQSHGVQILGPVPSGLPAVGVPLATPTELLGLLPGAVGLAILTFADTAATGRSFARRHGERTDANRELVALAAADAAGSLTGGYPVSSSPSRTSAAENAGSTTQMSGVVAFGAVAVVLVLLTGPLSYLPTPALGGVILVSVLGLIDLPSIANISRLKASEGLIALITMTGVILYGTLIGVMLAVLLAALNIVRRAAWPHVVEEGRLRTGLWRDLERSAGSRVAGVAVVRFSGPLFFANAAALDAHIRELVAERPSVSIVVIDLGPVADIDVTAGDTLRQIADDLARNGRRLAVALPLGPVRDELRSYGLADLMEPTGGTHGSVDDAIRGLGLDPAVIEPAGSLAGTAGEVDTGAGPDDGGAPASEEAGSDEVEAPVSVAAAAVPVAGTAPSLDEPAPSGAPQPAGSDRLALQVGGVVAAIVIAAVVLGAVLGAWTGGGTVASTVPNLIGMSLSRATTAATDAGFVLESPVYVARDDRPEGTVVAQTPTAGTAADEGDSIFPIVSTRRQLVSVPDVIGMPEAQAIATLTGAGLSVTRGDTVADTSVPAGTVVSTDPAPGVEVAAGAVVRYAVATGPGPGPGGDESEPPSVTPAPTGSGGSTVPPVGSPLVSASPESPADGSASPDGLAP